MTEPNVEQVAKALREKMKDLVSKKLEQPALENIKEQIVQTLMAPAMQGAIDTSRMPTVDACRLWTAMSFREKIQWFMLNRWPMKKLGHELREAFMALNADLYHMANETTDDLEEGVVPAYRPLPRVLEPDPKRVVLCAASIRLNKPLKFIEFNFTVGDEDGNNDKNRKAGAEAVPGNQERKPNGEQRAPEAAGN